jgi:SAM-dependent methyltransferase
MRRRAARDPGGGGASDDIIPDRTEKPRRPRLSGRRKVRYNVWRCLSVSAHGALSLVALAWRFAYQLCLLLALAFAVACVPPDRAHVLWAGLGVAFGWCAYDATDGGRACACSGRSCCYASRGHFVPNLQTSSSWLNLGLWRKGGGAAPRPNDYASACENLCLCVGNHARLHRKDRVLDVGFGRGDSIALWRRVYHVFAITGVNVSACEVEFARANMARYVSPHYGCAPSLLAAIRRSGTTPFLSLDAGSGGGGGGSGGGGGAGGSAGVSGSGTSGSAMPNRRGQLSPRSSRDLSAARQQAGKSPCKSAPVSEDEMEEMERTSRSSFSEEATGTIDFNNESSFTSGGGGADAAAAAAAAASAVVAAAIHDSGDFSRGGRLRSHSSGSTHSVSSNNSTSSNSSSKAATATAALATEGLEVRVGDATKLSLEDASFSKVVSIDAAYYFNTRDKFFAEAFRVLVPGGRLCVADICLQSYPTSCIGRFILFVLCLFAGVPRANMCACDEYTLGLTRTGFVNVQCRETLDNEVFLGYANFMRQQKFKFKDEIRSSLFSPHSAAASFFSFVGRMGWLSFVVVTADKPETGAPLANVNYRVSPPPIRSLRSASSLYQHA